MIKEALQYMFALNAERANPIAICPDDTEHYVYMVDGEAKEFDRPIRPRKHKVKSLGDLIVAVNKLSDNACVFFDSERVIGILDHAGHRNDSITFDLVESDQWICLSQPPGWMVQKDFIRLLRIDLTGCLPPTALLDRIKRLRIENSQTVDSEVGRKRESLGKSMVSSVSTEAEIPEEVLFSIPVFSSSGERERYQIRCAVELDPTRLDSFRLIPFPDEIERVRHQAMESIRARLTDGLPDFPVFYGSP